MNRRVTVWNPWRMSPFNMSDWDDWMVEDGDVRLDLYEDGDDVVVELVAPGFNKDNIDITVESNVLTLRGEAKEISEEEDKKRKYYRKEIASRSFTRNVELPSLVDSTKADAEFTDGILKIRMPKREEAKPKSISIKAK